MVDEVYTVELTKAEINRLRMAPAHYDMKPTRGRAGSASPAAIGRALRSDDV